MLEYTSSHALVHEDRYVEGTESRPLSLPRIYDSATITIVDRSVIYMSGRASSARRTETDHSAFRAAIACLIFSLPLGLFGFITSEALASAIAAVAFAFFCGFMVRWIEKNKNVGRKGLR